MAQYRTIRKEIWKSSWFPAADRDVQLFWIFLLTNPDTECSGLYPINWLVAGAYLRMDDATLARCRAAVEEVGAAFFEGNWLLIPNFLGYQPMPNANMWVSILKQAEMAPKSLLRRWLEAVTFPPSCQQEVSRMAESLRRDSPDIPNVSRTSA